MNTTRMDKSLFSATSIVRIATVLFFWTPVLLLSGLLVYNTIPYFTFSKQFTFLEAREMLYNKWVWRWSFYLHIAAGSFCILSAMLQFSSWILRKRKRIHIIAGKIYVFVVLV